MMSLLPSLITLIVLFLLTLIYFKVAERYNITDKPNARSSHTSITLRGGGVVFCLAGLLFYALSGFQYSFFIVGLFSISTISFLDDILTLNNKIRLAVHLFAVTLLFCQWDLLQTEWYWLILAGIIIIGIINAYNFMDGINGMTGCYSLIALVSLYYINNEVVSFTANDLLIIIGLSLLVFNFFNFRKKAKCFAGDVGSVSIAFIVVFLLGQLIFKTGNLAYILLLLIYGLDTAVTIAFRLFRKENIFEAHRSHFYQYLVNEKKLSHLFVAAVYGLLQLSVNSLLIIALPSSFSQIIGIILIAAALFIGLRFLVEGKDTLLKASNSNL